MKLSGVQRPGFHVWGTGSQSFVNDNAHETQKEKIIMQHDIAGSHEESEPDHGHSETSAGAGGPVPMSEPLSEAGGTAAPATAPATSPIAIPPLPPFPVCIINLKAGCYRITYRPVGFNVFNGTMQIG